MLRKRRMLSVLQGILAESYQRVSGTRADLSGPNIAGGFAPHSSNRFQGREEDHIMQDYFSTEGAPDSQSRLGLGHPDLDHRRRLDERGHVAFPLRFGARGMPSAVRMPSPTAFSAGVVDANPGDIPKPRRRLIEKAQLPRKLPLQ